MRDGITDSHLCRGVLAIHYNANKPHKTHIYGIPFQKLDIVLISTTPTALLYDKYIIRSSDLLYIHL